MEGKTRNKTTTEHVSCQMMLRAVETIEKDKAERERGPCGACITTAIGQGSPL